MKIHLVDLLTQYQNIKQEIDSAIQSVIQETAFIGGFNNLFVRQFEESFARFLGVHHCVSCANGTDSLEILLKSTGIGVGDEVIVPALSWISTSEAVSNIGAKPIFVDIDEKTYTIDVTKIEEKITSKTKAIIPVHLYGHPAEMDSILKIAKNYNLYIIEDCAQAHGAEYKGKKVGTIGHAGSFSFFPGKNLGAYGDAGGMVTNDFELAEKARMIANHGQKKKHDHWMEGRNSRLDGIQAAVLNVKLKYLEKWTENRREIAKTYSTYLKEEIITPKEAGTVKHVFHLYVIRAKDREGLRIHLHHLGIETAIHYPLPLPYLKPYQSHLSSNEYPIASKVCNEILSLPIYPEMSNDTVQKIIESVNNYE